MIPLALQGVRTAWRERVLLVGPLYVALIAFMAPVAATLSMGSPARGLRDGGLTLLWLTLIGTAAVLGSRAIGAELRDGTAAVLLSRPISRATWVSGRALGVLASLALVVATSTAGWSAVVLAWGVPLDADIAWSSLLLLIEASVVATAARCLSTALHPSWAGTCALALWLVSHLAGPYGALAEARGGALAVVDAVVFTVLPDLATFDVRDRVLEASAVDGVAALAAGGYGCAWVAGLFFLASWMAGRRDIT